MITGFNTDIEFGGVTYHVQTEDKGLAKPIILSLVYDRGTILASKRLPYDDLLKGDFDERKLEERLHRQHKLICAAIRAGRIDELKKLSKRAPVSAVALASDAGEAEQLADLIEVESSIYETAPIRMPDTDDQAMPIPRPDIDGEIDLDDAMANSIPVVEAVSIIEEVVVVPDNAVEIVSDMAGRDRPKNDKLSIELLGEVSFKGGDRKTVGVMVCRGSERKVIENAQIMIKIIGSSFRPLIFHASTDANGIARVNLQLPKFKSGRAAFLVRAMSSGEEIELRRPIAHG